MRVTDYVQQWSEDAVRKLNRATQGKRFKYKPIAAKEEETKEGTHEEHTIASTIFVNRSALGGSNVSDPPSHVSCLEASYGVEKGPKDSFRNTVRFVHELFSITISNSS